MSNGSKRITMVIAASETATMENTARISNIMPTR
jgi:hypothetical protein